LKKTLENVVVELVVELAVLQRTDMTADVVGLVDNNFFFFFSIFLGMLRFEGLRMFVACSVCLYPSLVAQFIATMVAQSGTAS